MSDLSFVCKGGKRRPHGRNHLRFDPRGRAKLPTSVIQFHKQDAHLDVRHLHEVAGLQVVA